MLAQFQEQKHEQAYYLQKCPRWSSGSPGTTGQSPKSEAASESSGFLPEYDLISFKERGQTFKSSNLSTVEQQFVLTFQGMNFIEGCFKRLSTILLVLNTIIF